MGNCSSFRKQPLKRETKLGHLSGVSSAIQTQIDAVSPVTINNDADNRLITGSGTAQTLNGEANLTFDGSTLDLFGTLSVSRKIIHRGDENTYIDFTGDDISFFAGGVEFISLNEAGSDTITLHQNTTASGTVSMNKVAKRLNTFLDLAFDNEGNRISENIIPTPSKKACKWCEFKNTQYCSVGV